MTDHQQSVAAVVLTASLTLAGAMALGLVRWPA